MSDKPYSFFILIIKNLAQWFRVLVTLMSSYVTFTMQGGQWSPGEFLFLQDPLTPATQLIQVLINNTIFVNFIYAQDFHKIMEAKQMTKTWFFNSFRQRTINL